MFARSRFSVSFFDLRVFLQGVRAVIAESFAELHRNQLVGMGIMPLQFLPEQNADSLQLSGKEKFTVAMSDSLSPRQQLTVKVRTRDCVSLGLAQCSGAIVTPCLCFYSRPARESLSASRPCSTASSTSSSSVTEVTSDTSLGLSSENNPPPLPHLSSK